MWCGVSLVVPVQREGDGRLVYRANGKAIVNATTRLVHSLKDVEFKKLLQSASSTESLQYGVSNGGEFTTYDQLWDALTLFESEKEGDFASAGLVFLAGVQVYKIEGIYSEVEGGAGNNKDYKGVVNRFDQKVKDLLAEGFEPAVEEVFTAGVEEVKQELQGSSSVVDLDALKKFLVGENAGPDLLSELDSFAEERNFQPVYDTMKVNPSERKDLVYVDSPLDVYEDRDSVSVEVAERLVKTQKQGILPAQYDTEGNISLNAQGSVPKGLIPVVLDQYNLYTLVSKMLEGEGRVDRYKNVRVGNQDLTYLQALALRLVCRREITSVAFPLPSPVNQILQVVVSKQQETFKANFKDLDVASLREGVSVADVDALDVLYRTASLSVAVVLVSFMYENNYFDVVGKGIPDLSASISREQFSDLFSR